MEKYLCVPVFIKDKNNRLTANFGFLPFYKVPYFVRIYNFKS